MAEYQARMAQEIRRERDRRGWSRDRVGREIDVSAKTIERWEKAQSEPQADNLRALAEFLGVAVDELRPLPETQEEAIFGALARIEAKLDQLLESANLTPSAGDAIEHLVQEIADRAPGQPEATTRDRKKPAA